MQERRVEFSHVVSTIENRLLDEEVKFFESAPDENFLAAVDKRETDKLLRDIKDEPAPGIRSETVITPEELKELNTRVEDVRSLIFSHGEHPPYRDWVEDGSRSPEEYEDLYHHRVDEDWYTADRTRPLSAGALGGYRLLVNASDAKKEVDIDLGFDGRFRLEIGFMDLTRTDRVGYGYNSGRLPLERMSDEEHKVISHYLGRYIEHTRQQPR